MISYAIGVCNESRELGDLLAFLTGVKRPQDEIVVLCDEGNTSDEVRRVLAEYPGIKVFHRKFARDFADHKNHLTSCCSGDYIFNIDADEIPQEMLIRVIEKMTNEGTNDLIWVPRINICPGYTQAFLKKHNFHCNQNGWINWPDYQGRVYRKSLEWSGKVHEKISGAKSPIGLKDVPQFALWHIKSVAKQNKQNALYDQI